MAISKSAREKRYLAVIAILSSIILFTIYNLDVLAEAKVRQYHNILGNDRVGHDSSVKTSDEKLGYVTWLGKTGNGSDTEDIYFIATRILVYQILHSPATKSPRGLPIIVMATPDVTPENKKRLEADGATVVPINFVEEGRSWVKLRRPTWVNLMSKLRAWELTEYSRLLLLDGDMILRRPLDGIFDEPNATTYRTPLPDSVVPRKPKEAPLPARYLFAGGPEVNGPYHHWPPSRKNNDFIHPSICNAGFVLLAPSKELFNYYMSVLKIPKSFKGDTGDQSLMNYAHRPNGPMPWYDLPPTWNIRTPLEEDIRGNVASLHDKWWEKPKGYPALGGWYRTVKKEMEDFYAARDRTAAST